jgi:DNA modification methylase
MAGEKNGRRVYAIEISPAYVDVAIERWQAATDKNAILDGDGRTFATVKAERQRDMPPDAFEPDTDLEPARRRKSAA